MFKLLKEKFNSSLPDWLKQAIMNLPYYDKNKISWDSCSFEEREIPKTMRTAKKDDTKLPVFLVDNGQNKVLIIPGVIEGIVAYYRHYGRYGMRSDPVYSDRSVFKHWDIVHFGVLNVDSKTKEKQKLRDDNVKGIEHRWKRTDKETGYWGDEEYVNELGKVRTFNKKYDDDKLDKSGYNITNPRKYARMLNDKRASNSINKYVKEAESVYNSLTDLRTRLKEFLDNDDVSDSKIDDAEYLFRKAINDYNSSLYYLERLCELEDEEGEGFANDWRFNDRVEDFEEYIKKAEESTKKLEGFFDKEE